YTPARWIVRRGPPLRLLPVVFPLVASTSLSWYDLLMVKVACPACAKTLRFQEKYLGRKIHCPGCGHPQVLTQPSEFAITQDTPPVTTPHPERSESMATHMPATVAIRKGDGDYTGRDNRNIPSRLDPTRASQYGIQPAGVAMAGTFLAPPE